MASTVGDNVPKKEKSTVICPLPRSFYGPESPCSRTDEVFTGDPQDPWVQPAGDFGGLKWLFYGGAALFALWLAVRALEAYAALKKV